MTKDRSETRIHLLETAARLLHDKGAAALTIRAVAQAAGLQAPALYRFFEDKDALLDAVAEHVFAAYVSTKTADEDGDPVDDLRAGWLAHIGFGLANPALFGLLVTPGRTSPAAEAGLAVLRARVHRVAETGRLRVPEALAVELIHAAGTGAVLTLLTRPADGLADALYEAVAARILTDAPAPSAGPPELPMLTGAERALLREWLDRG
ncbi:DNA-binding transcriptional regulator, AcrR family [Amycolatopsis pretoriensis]|uniref:DNA-binding transcriptional regulator, AcrR family n=1 Tax=Amycolatopsis pretoriensis TaxID=218821 RepID=A0A1H5QBW7_9PSEU|nr:TetR/AcrR family transcriptional regulator [Amycolatopsis pretoriensis]SEF23612.1 DNA-binding transcriptional regulator, AcrR family [Amycolatopsis pretoriensis]